MFTIAKQLREAGVLGINERNANYILRHNPRKLYPLVDNKLLTKQLAQQAGIAVPELYHVVEIEKQVKQLPERLEQLDAFVIKPAHGFGGNGIIIITGQRKNTYRKTGGSRLTATDLQHHVSNILSGLYSLGGQPDKALIEYLVRFDPVFSDIAYSGVPDIRIIIFFGVPVMAMIRLPTRSSEGKANLHQGAIGAGIDIATGKTLSAVWKNKIITEHPDTGNLINDIQIPYWKDILDIAVRCYDISPLGYQGVDIVLDKDKGPLMLELNARPGLNIQVANHRGLLKRLKLVEQNISSLITKEARITFAKQHFGTC